LGGCKKRYKKSIAAAAVLHVKVGAQVVVTLDWLAINFFFWATRGRENGAWVRVNDQINIHVGAN
jgi:hypothetical protein